MDTSFNEISGICGAFGLSGLSAVTEITAGKVNHTFKADFVVDGSLQSYIVQKVNTYVFKKPQEVMKNIERITDHIASVHPEALSIKYIHTSDGKNYLEQGDSFWRMYRFIDSVTYNSSKDPKIVYNAGRAFGAFQKSLMDFDASLLYYTIPDFHNTPKRFADFSLAFKSDPLGRAASCRAEYEYIMSMREKACVLSTLYDVGRIPLRVTHNDTKINNVLFDPATGDAICVVDLDTVMPGLAGHDFGDAIRSAANSMGSASLEFDKVGIDMGIYRAFAEGYLSQAGSILMPAEISSLAQSSLVMTMELASRYVADYLTGNVYFKAKYDTQNLDRARNLIALGKSMDSHMDEMKAVVDEIVKG